MSGEDAILLLLILGSLSVLAVLAGLVMIGASAWSASQHRVTADLTAGAVWSGAGVRVPLGELRGLRFEPGVLTCRLVAVKTDGDELALVKAGSGVAGSLESAATRLAAFVERPLVGPSPMNGRGANDRLFAACCYLPLQGVFLIASVAALVSSRSDYVRFAARQSLLHLAAVIVTVGLALVGCGPVVAFTEGTLQLVAAVLLGLVLTAVAVGNLVVRVIATYRAYRGTQWVFPWLVPLLGRSAPSLPNEPSAAASVFE